MDVKNIGNSNKEVVGYNRIWNRRSDDSKNERGCSYFENLKATMATEHISAQVYTYRFKGEA